MEATRIRFGSILEWLLAAAFVAGLVGVVTTLITELRTVRAIVPVIAGEPPAVDAPAAVPPRAVSLPMLLLGEGREVRLGDRLSEVAARLDAAAKLASESLERNALQERLTRIYQYAGTEFVLVFDTPERNAEPRVAGIYLR